MLDCSRLSHSLINVAVWFPQTVGQKPTKPANIPFLSQLVFSAASNDCVLLGSSSDWYWWKQHYGTHLLFYTEKCPVCRPAVRGSLFPPHNVFLMVWYMLLCTVYFCWYLCILPWAGAVQTPLCSLTSLSSCHLFLWPATGSIFLSIVNIHLSFLGRVVLQRNVVVQEFID